MLWEKASWGVLIFLIVSLFLNGYLSFGLSHKDAA